MDKNKKCPYCGEEILAKAKKCKYCGEWLTEQTEAKETEQQEKKMTICPICAEQIEIGTKACPYCHEVLTKEESRVKEETEKEEMPKPTLSSTNPRIEKPSTDALSEDEKTTEQACGFFSYYFIDVFFRHYTDFKGKISRKQFWMGYLCYALFICVLSCLDLLIGSPFIITIIASFALIVPGIAFIVRRLHDIGKSGWWILIYLIPLIGPIWWLVLLCKKGETKPLHVKYRTKDFIVWAAGILIVIGLSIKLITMDASSYSDRQPLYPDGTTVSFYNDEYLTYLIDYKEIDKKTTPDGKNIVIREDVFGSDWDYMSYTWLCIEDESIYRPLVLVSDWKGLHYIDFAILDDETIRIELAQGQNTPYTLETIVYDLANHKIVDRKEEAYKEEEAVSSDSSMESEEIMESGEFCGYINGEYAVTLNLIFDDHYKGTQEVNGYYYYNKNGSENTIILKGDYNIWSGELNLTEYTADGTPNGTFSAVKVPQGFRGIFTDMKGKEMSFFVSPLY